MILANLKTMLDPNIDGRLQVTAAASLLEASLLVRWNPVFAQFTPAPRDEFESLWQRDIDPVFGRLICWISFSAGAEFLAKGVCLLNGVDIRLPKSPKKVPAYPSSDLPSWIADFRRDWRSHGILNTTNFGTLGNLVGENSRPGFDLKQLCVTVGARPDQEELLLAAYDFLARTIRNRDAHAYVPNVRDHHHSLVPDLFATSFNLLLTWLPGGHGTLNKWRDEAARFIASL